MTSYVAAAIPHSLTGNLFPAFDHIQEAFFFFNTRFEINYMNRQAHKIAQKIYRFQPVLGGNILAYVSNGRRRDFKKVLEGVLHGQSAEYEIEVEEMDIWLRCKYFPSTDSDGNINGIYGLLTDVTAKKEFNRLEQKTVLIEQNLFQSRLLFEQFMQNSPIISWVTDGKGIMHYMNPILLKTYGCTEKDFGKTIFELFDPQLAADYQINNQQVLKTGEAIETVERGLTANGGQQVLKIYKFPLTVNGEVMVGGWAVDITDQVEMQDQLIKSIERHEYVNEATSDAIYDWDFSTRRLYKSARFEELFGYAEKEISLRHRLKHIHPDDVKKFRDVVFSSLRDPDVTKWEIEYRLLNAGGEYKTVWDKSFIIRGPEKVQRVIGALRDVTAQNELQKKLVEQEKRNKREVVKSVIETQEKERRQLSVELHDNVNQMLASCKLMLEVALEGEANAKMLTEKSYQSIQGVINEIRRISHDLNPSAIVDVGLVEAINGLIEKINLSGKIQVHLVTDKKGYKFCLKEEDKVAIFRIVQEQLNNILKHAQAQNVLIKLQVEDGVVQLCIKDDGVGFDVARSKKGLGLRNIYNRVEYYGGSLNINSSAGNGCEMCITLNTGSSAYVKHWLKIA